MKVLAKCVSEDSERSCFGGISLRGGGGGGGTSFKRCLTIQKSIMTTANYVSEYNAVHVYIIIAIILCSSWLSTSPFTAGLKHDSYS